MNSKEMFEKLGYIKHDNYDDENNIWYKSINDPDDIFIFRTNDNTDHYKQIQVPSRVLTNEVFQAINQQRKELKWDNKANYEEEFENACSYLERAFGIEKDFWEKYFISGGIIEGAKTIEVSTTDDLEGM